MFCGENVMLTLLSKILIDQIVIILKIDLNIMIRKGKCVVGLELDSLPHWTQTERWTKPVLSSTVPTGKRNHLQMNLAEK